MGRYFRPDSSKGFIRSGLLVVMVVFGLAQAVYAAGGALDPAYGSGGLFVGGTGNGQAAVLDSSGRLVIAGSVASTGYNDFAVIRVLPNGALDSSFGGSGIVTTDFGQESDGQAVAIDSQGRIVVAGTVGTMNGNFAVARYNSDGSPDLSFNSSGTITTDFGNNNDGATGVAIDSTNRIIVVGFAYIGTTFDFAVARYIDSGLDASFGTGGKVLTDFNGRNDQANAVTIDASGEIVVAGYSADSNTQVQDFALARYSPLDGSLDAGFGSAGEVLTAFSGNARANAVAIDGSGNIVAAGVAVGTANDFALARYTSGGVLDMTFNGTGMVTTDFGGNETAHGVAIDAAGHIVAAGAFTPNDGSGNTFFALARYNSDASLDSSFGTGGEVTTSFGNGAHTTAMSVAMDSLQRIVVAGSDTSNTFIAARYLSADADLAISKQGPPSVPAGQPLTYTITVSNTGPDATFAQVDDPLPTGVTFSAPGTSQNCKYTAPIVTCALDSIAAGKTSSVNITVVPSAYVTTVTNTATVEGNDPNPGNNTSSWTTAITPAADLVITKTGPATVSPGSSIVYSIKVTNNGPSSANNVTVNDPLSDKFIDAIGSQGSSCVFTRSKGSGTVNCNLGAVFSGNSAFVTITVAAPKKKGTTSNTATVTATEFDPDTTNNSSTATVLVQ